MYQGGAAPTRQPKQRASELNTRKPYNESEKLLSL
jgi:hypothetical protein